MKGIGFVLPLVALTLCVIWVGYSVVYKNLESKDVVFSYSALVAAVAMLVLNIFFSLQKEEKRGKIDIHLYVQNEIIDIYSVLNKPNYLVFGREDISKALFQKETAEEITREDSKEKTLKNFIRLAIMGTYLDETPDWNKKVTGEFIGSTQISYRCKKEQAKKTESFCSKKDIVEILGIDGIGEDVIGHTSFHEGLILPPKTEVTSNHDSIFIENNFLKITMQVAISPNFNICAFHYKADNKVFFDMGKTGPLSVFGQINFHIEKKKQNAGNPHMKDYLEWSNDLYQMLSYAFSPTHAHINMLS